MICGDNKNPLDGKLRVSFLGEIIFQAGSKQCHPCFQKLIGWQSNYNMYLFISYIAKTYWDQEILHFKAEYSPQQLAHSS